MKKFGVKDRVLVGITLFSMFFGAGNLIFPPFLGAQAGSSTPAAFLGFAVSAVFLPVLGVVAVTKSGGLENLASRVHPKFSFIYILILYLAIGPCLAIPRTASTSFSMAVTPFWENGDTLAAVQLVYSVVFFLLAAFVALHPERLTEYLGKKLTPILLCLIILIFAAAVFHPAGKAAEPLKAYQGAAAVQGFLDGYQTMDTLAALNFGMIVALNIREKGLDGEKKVMGETIRAGWIAGGVLLAVYGMLAFLGMVSSQHFAGNTNGTETLTDMMNFLFGNVGAVLLAVVFVIACFNTCVGLFSCCGNYFSKVFPKISYRNWVFLFAFVSLIIANVGLNAILKFSVPVLNAIYPLAILLIFLSCIHQWIAKDPLVYPIAAVFCGVSSLVSVLDSVGAVIPCVTGVFRMIPGYQAGFCWIIPTAIGGVIGCLAERYRRK